MGYYICAVVLAKEGKVDELLSMVDKIFEHVQTKEPETLQYQITRNSEKPNEFVVWEEYTNEAAFKFHTSSDAFQAFAKAIPELCEGGKIDLKKVELQKRHLSKDFAAKSKM